MITIPSPGRCPTRSATAPSRGPGSASGPRPARPPRPKNAKPKQQHGRPYPRSRGSAATASKAPRMEAPGGCPSSEQTADPAALHNTPFRRALRSAKPTPASVQNGGTACVLFKPPVLLNVMLEWWRRRPEQPDAPAPGQVRARADLLGNSCGPAGTPTHSKRSSPSPPRRPRGRRPSRGTPPAWPPRSPTRPGCPKPAPRHVPPWTLPPPWAGRCRQPKTGRPG